MTQLTEPGKDPTHGGGMPPKMPPASGQRRPSTPWWWSPWIPIGPALFGAVFAVAYTVTLRIWELGRDVTEPPDAPAFPVKNLPGTSLEALRQRYPGGVISPDSGPAITESGPDAGRVLEADEPQATPPEQTAVRSTDPFNAPASDITTGSDPVVPTPIGRVDADPATLQPASDLQPASASAAPQRLEVIPALGGPSGPGNTSRAAPSTAPRRTDPPPRLVAPPPLP
ncbi:MAG: hypothetical protein ERJ68_06590 [Aphanocapsa feldmannii 277cI]|uniref:Uncharacterized protein n=1 Tax=Aphanocapsa feldmannii 277cI TaxID=2507554 RepID=A0A524RTJ7_9CHRO|nr:MAG: hypothetical protein ERJ68_06590 [Aphanocapsa feldmannii 277cI]